MKKYFLSKCEDGVPKEETKHPEHICRFNDGDQTCDCYDAGYNEARRTQNSGRKMYEIGVKEGYSSRISVIEEVEGIATKLKQIPVVIPHGNPYLTGYNVALSDLLAKLSSLKQDSGEIK